ncbi:hypothetical protein BGX31_000788 [Mortierella sp. GBA43]|nr:hypothetical protein BGX31_000788 [Mortierella sp. GBA43]
MGSLTPSASLDLEPHPSATTASERTTRSRCAPNASPSVASPVTTTATSLQDVRDTDLAPPPASLDPAQFPLDPPLSPPIPSNSASSRPPAQATREDSVISEDLPSRSLSPFSETDLTETPTETLPPQQNAHEQQPEETQPQPEETSQSEETQSQPAFQDISDQLIEAALNQEDNLESQTDSSSSNNSNPQTPAAPIDSDAEMESDPANQPTDSDIDLAEPEDPSTSIPFTEVTKKKKKSGSKRQPTVEGTSTSRDHPYGLRSGGDKGKALRGV